MNMKKLIASVIAGAVAVSAMATGVFADEIPVTKITTANKTTVTFGTVAVPTGTGFVDGTLKFSITQANADNVTGTVVDLLPTAADKDDCNFTVSGTLAQTVTGNIVETTDKFTFTDVSAADVNTRVATFVIPTTNVDIAAANKFEIRDLKIEVANAPADFDASKVKMTLTALTDSAATAKAAATAGTISDFDTTYTIGDFPLLASEVKDAAENGAVAKITFKKTTADKTTLKVDSTQSRKTYSVEVAKGATSAEIELPKEAFTAGVANTLTFKVSAVKVTSATLTINEDAAETEAPEETTTEETTDEDKNPPTGAAPVALALIPAALAAVVVAKKRK